MNARFDQLLKISDAALYLAKDAGRNRAVIGSLQPGGAGAHRHETEHHATPNLQMIASG